MRILDNNVLIDENKSVDRLSAGVFVIPDVGTIPMAYGRIIKVGEGLDNPELENDKIPFFVKENDFVVYNPGVAIPIEVTTKKAGTTIKIRINPKKPNKAYVPVKTLNIVYLFLTFIYF